MDEGYLLRVDSRLDLMWDRGERIHLDGTRAGATGPGRDGQAVGEDGRSDDAAPRPHAGLVENWDGHIAGAAPDQIVVVGGQHADIRGAGCGPGFLNPPGEHGQRAVLGDHARFRQVFQALRAQVTGRPDQAAKSSTPAGAYAAR